MGIVTRLNWEGNTMKARKLEMIRKRYGQCNEIGMTADRLNYLRDYTDIHGTTLDDITWNDLDMDEVYIKMNTTFSWMGESYLHYILRNPVVEQIDCEMKKEFIQYFQENKEIRESVQLECIKNGKKQQERTYYTVVRALMEQMKVPVTSFLATILMIGSLIFALFTGEFSITIGVVMVNFITYYAKKSNGAYTPEVLERLVCLEKSARTIGKMKWTIQSGFFHLLKEEQKDVHKSLRMVRWVAASGNGNSLESTIFEFLKAMFHFDMIQLYFISKQLRAKQEQIEGLIEKIGYLESMIVIASYRESLDNYTIPMHEEGSELEIVEGCHPLLDQAIPNTIYVKRGALITGSNASGKSTFLKMVALNVLLSQTICTCLVKSYQGPIFQIYSAMSLRDNIKMKDSYYIAEMKAIKRMLNERGKEIPTICFVDEIFRGTNTIERVAAATEVMTAFLEGNLLCLGATHDIELTQTLHPLYEMYYFQETVEDGILSFDYKLHSGISTTRNAIALLELFGFDETITKQAKERISRYEATHKWC